MDNRISKSNVAFQMVRGSRRYTFIELLMLIVVLTIAIFSNINGVKASEQAIGIKVYYKDLMGNQVGTIGYILRNEDLNFTNAYEVYPTLPSFTSDNQKSILNEFMGDENNINAIINLIGLRNLEQAKANNYSLVIEGIYGGAKTQYRSRTCTTCKSDEQMCSNVGNWKRVADTCSTAGMYKQGIGWKTGWCTKKACPTGWYYCEMYESDITCVPDASKSDCIKGCSKWGKWSLYSDNEISEIQTTSNLREVQSKIVGDYSYSSGVTLSFERVNISQAALCEQESTYRDVLSIENVIGSAYFLDEKLGNKDYCPVYCVEENKYIWPGFKPTANVGGNFTWTLGETKEQNIITGLTVELKGNRNCRTHIDLDKWQKDYNDVIEKIIEEEKTLVKDAQYKNICLPKLGSKGCGYKITGEAIKPGNDFSSNFGESGAAFANGETIVAHEMVGEIHSSKFITLRTIVPGTLSEFGTATTPMVTYQYKEITLESLCPCDWYDETELLRNPSIYEGISVKKNDDLYAKISEVCDESGTERVGQGLTKTKFGFSLTLESYKCQYKEIDIPTGSNVCTRRACVNGSGNEIASFSSEIACTANGYTWECLSERPDTVRGVNVTSIKEEYCNSNKEEYNYDGFCRPYGPYCETGYHLATDNKCYKNNTSDLKDLLIYQQTLIDVLRECSKMSFDYKLDTEMSVDFEEPIYGETPKLQGERTTFNEKENHKVHGSETYKAVQYKVCSLNGLKKICWTESRDVTEIWIKEYGKEFNVAYEYTMPTNFYRWVTLPNGVSISQEPTGEYKKFGRYIDVGYANYPVHFNTNAGTYNLDINYKNVGYNNHFTEYITENIDNETSIITYNCEYDVKKGEPYCPTDDCDEGSVRLIYRPISLENPFPGMSGNGRETGNNWCTLNETDSGLNCKNDLTNETVNKYILKNRNIEGNNIYTKDPMYKIVLTPALIKSIREYNEKTDYDDYNLSCSTEEGKEGTECRSYFVSPNAAKDLEQTGLDTIGGAITGCGVDSSFKACDGLDGYER